MSANECPCKEVFGCAICRPMPAKYTKETSSTANEWMMAIMEASSKSADIVPSEFKTRQQIEKEINLGTSQTNKILKNLIECGKAEKRSFKIEQSNGVYPIVHYKIIK